MAKRNKVWLRFDEVSDVIASVELLALVSSRLVSDVSLWKWAIVATHNAMQGALVCALHDSSGVGILTEKTAKAVLRWHKTQQGGYPTTRLADFKELVDRAQLKKTLTLTAGERKTVDKLHEEFRNNFSHFQPMSWSIEIAGLPTMVLTMLTCVEQLMTSENVTYKFHTVSRGKGKLQRYMRTARKNLEILIEASAR